MFAFCVGFGLVFYGVVMQGVVDFFEFVAFIRVELFTVVCNGKLYSLVDVDSD